MHDTIDIIGSMNFVTFSLSAKNTMTAHTMTNIVPVGIRRLTLEWYFSDSIPVMDSGEVVGKSSPSASHDLV